MTPLHTIILGLVEGITEFLPISSTGHLLMASNILNIQQTDFVKSFDVIIQLGAICAVGILYFKTILTNINLIKKIILGFIPTAIIGFLLYDKIKIILGNILVVPIALILGGVVILLVENYIAKKQALQQVLQNEQPAKSITNKESFLMGVFQTLAFIPGVSRSGAVIIGGLLRGLKRSDVVMFSFMLALPTMLAASGMDIFKNGFNFTNNEWLMLCVGFTVSFITAFIAVKSFLKFISNHTFKAFGWYRIIIGILFLVFFI